MFSLAIISTISIATARAIFFINKFEVLEDEGGWHGLKDNECWNSQINAEDPGWALLAEDEFYAKGQHPELAIYTPRYTKLPEIKLLKPGGVAIKPKYSVFSSIDYSKYAKIFEKHPLSDEYPEVLGDHKTPRATRLRHRGIPQRTAHYLPKKYYKTCSTTLEKKLWI